MENPIATIMSAKFGQVQKYLTLSGPSRSALSRSNMKILLKANEDAKLMLNRVRSRTIKQLVLDCADSPLSKFFILNDIDHVHD